MTGLFVINTHRFLWQKAGRQLGICSTRCRSPLVTLEASQDPNCLISEVLRACSLATWASGTSAAGETAASPCGCWRLVAHPLGFALAAGRSVCQDRPPRQRMPPMHVGKGLPGSVGRSQPGRLVKGKPGQILPAGAEGMVRVTGAWLHESKQPAWPTITLEARL